MEEARFQGGHTLATKRDSIRLKLTPEQQEQIKRATGRDAELVELQLEELEERIMPGGTGGLGSR